MLLNRKGESSTQKASNIFWNHGLKVNWLEDLYINIRDRYKDFTVQKWRWCM